MRGILVSLGYNSFDDTPWILELVEFVKKVLAQSRIRIIGVCFGHQIVGRAMGKKVGRSDAGWEVSVSQVELTSKGKDLFGKNKLVFGFLFSIPVGSSGSFLLLFPFSFAAFPSFARAQIGKRWRSRFQIKKKLRFLPSEPPSDAPRHRLRTT